jgi:tetratricopeptide (TPR) repeat protein
LSDLDFLEVRPAGEFMATRWATDLEPVSSEAVAATLVSRLGAGVLVSGTYYTSGPGLEFHVQILEFPGGDIMEAIGPVRSESLDPMEAVDIIRQRVAVALAIHLDENLAPLSASTFPPTFEAYQAYSSGALKFVSGDRAAAVADLEEAYHRSPDFTAPLIYAAFGRLGLGDPSGADSLAKILEADKENLPPYDRHRVDLLQARLRGDNAEAYRAVRRAAELLDGGSAHYMSAQMALELNRPREALEILQTFDMTREWAQGWANYWNVVTAAHHLLGNHDRELELAGQGYQLNPDRMLMLAWEVRALAGLGRWEEIKPLLARTGSIRGPDRMTAGTVMLIGAQELQRHGYYDEAMACLNEALNWIASRALEDPGSAGLQAFRAQVLYQKGTLEQRGGSEGATATLRQAQLEFAALARDAPENLSSLGHRGVIHARLGKAAEARELSDSLRALERPYLWGQNTYWRARIAALLGERDEAVRLLWQSVGEGVSFGMSMHADPDLEPLLDFPPFQEFIRPKG